MKVSAAFSFYGDFDYLEKCLERVAPLVDQIVLLDGPFKYAVPILKALELYYTEPSEQFRRLIDKYNVKYSYEIFENEGEKRIKLYEMCDCDVIFLVDADELITSWSHELFEDFVKSDYAVAPLRLTNMCRDGSVFGNGGYKHILLKREAITAEQHLNYTWLVGWKQEAPNRDLMFKTPIGEMDHYTLRRSIEGNAIKFSFYTSLWKYNNDPEKLQQIGELPFEDALACVGNRENLRFLFSRSMPEMLNINTSNDEIKKAAPTEETPEKQIDLENRALLVDGAKLTLLPGLPRVAELSIPDYKREGSEIHFSFEADEGEKIGCRAFVRSQSRSEWINVVLETSNDKMLSHIRHGVFKLPCDSTDVFAVFLEFRAKVSDVNKLVEVSDFHQKRSLLIHGNCQSESLAQCLESNVEFQKRFLWIPTPGRLVHIQSIEQLNEFYELANEADCFVLQQVSDNYRGEPRFGTAAILDHVGKDRPVVLYPNLFFNGYNTGVYVVRTRSGEIIQTPMPIHDVNLIYSYLKCDMERERAIEEYRDLVSNPDHPVGRNGCRHCENSLNELRHRVAELQRRFGEQPNVKIIDYFSLLAEHYDQFVSHYSDAHPVERIFELVSEEISRHLGLNQGTFRSELDEKGALPILASVSKVIGLNDLKHDLYINSKKVSFEELTNIYLETYSKMTNIELHSYISRDTSKFIITNHKTGTRSMENFIRRYCELSGLRAHIYKGDPEHIDFSKVDLTLVFHSQHFNEILEAHPDLKYRAIHLYREAKNVITSGAHYHTVTDEPWCHAKVFDHAANEKWEVVQ